MRSKVRLTPATMKFMGYGRTKASGMTMAEIKDMTDQIATIDSGYTDVLIGTAKLANQYIADVLRPIADFADRASQIPGVNLGTVPRRIPNLALDGAGTDLTGVWNNYALPLMTWLKTLKMMAEGMPQEFEARLTSES